MNQTRPLRAVLAVVVLCLCSSAFAVDSYDALIFRPSPDLGNYFSLFDSQTHDRHKFNAQFYLGYENHPLQLTTGAVRTGGVIENLLVGHFGGAVGLLDWLEVGGDLPVAFVNSLAGASGAHTSLGDFELFSKFRLLDIAKHPVGVSIAPYLRLPSGNADHFVGTGTVSGGVSVAVEFHPVDRLNLALNAGALIRNKVVRLGTEMSSSATAGLGLDVRMFRDLHGIVEFNVATPFDDFGRRSVNSPLTADAGVRQYFKNGVFLTAGGGVGILNGIGSPRARGFVSVGYQDFHNPYVSIPPPPPEKGLANEVYLLSLKCPPAAAYDAKKDDAACPKLYDLRERNVRCGETGSSKDPSCSEIYELRSHDADHDGVYDLIDLCPDQEGAKTATLFNRDRMGCPETGRAAFVSDKSEIQTLPVYFEFGSSILTPAASQVLYDLAGFLKNHPEYRKISIEGHTDNIGSDAHNLQLSRDRANEVRKYLVELGLEPERLETKGFGERIPVADNDTDIGRARNRRVNFVVLP